MAQVGQISRGTVVKVLNYGALVRLDDGCLGLVHISEIDERYVRNVTDYVAEDLRVIVKVLHEKEAGRFEFSIKQAKNAKLEEQDEIEEPEEDLQARSVPFVSMAHNHSRAAFDEKLREFLTDSSERLGDIRRHNDHKLKRR
jgi:S1 RNA binding domain protein